ncbi:MAG: hypothetical protein NC177_11105 [Ruminococcus flavefaciens]|nr:hypothetical protein [Ruminococcus flavefaciens]
MIKGVNRKIIEVNRTDSIYFEKAVFYLRPEVRELPTEISRAEAEKYIAQLMPEVQRKKKFPVKIVIPLTLVAVGFIILQFIIIN